MTVTRWRRDDSHYFHHSWYTRKRSAWAGFRERLRAVTGHMHSEWQGYRYEIEISALEL